VKQSSVRYVVSDGGWLFVDRPVDFGDAICGSNICVWKSDIRSAHFSEARSGLPSPEAVLIAPVMAVAMFGMIQPTITNGSKAPGPGIAELMPACAASRQPSPMQDALASERALSDWAWDNQRSVSTACLLEAAVRFQGTDRSKNIRLGMLAHAKNAWTSARCKDAQIAFRVVPILAGAHLSAGDPDWILWAREIVADDATYADDLAPDACQFNGGVAPISEWDDRKQMLKPRLDPFSRDPFIFYGALAGKIPPDDDPHPPHNRRVPAIAKP
jgi:hypothetical protein